MAHIRVRESFGLKPEGSVARRGRKQRGEARYPRAIEPRCLKVALPAFMTTYPELEIELSSTDRQVDPVQEGFDCVLRIGPIGDDALIARPLGRLRMVNVASSAYLARVGVPLSVEDLMTQNHRTIHYSRTFSARPYGWKYPDAGGYATLPLRGALHVNSVQTYEATGLAGLGLIQAAFLGVRQHLESGALVEVLPDHRPEPLDIAFVVAHQSNLSRRVRTFIAWTEEVMSPYLE
jgi:DNA-binding transcriptional LysR family regulator